MECAHGSEFKFLLDILISRPVSFSWVFPGLVRDLRVPRNKEVFSRGLYFSPHRPLNALSLHHIRKESKLCGKVGITVIDFFKVWPRPLILNSEIRVLGEPLGLRGKEVVFFEMEWPGSNPEPRASEEDTLSTPPRPTWQNVIEKKTELWSS